MVIMGIFYAWNACKVPDIMKTFVFVFGLQVANTSNEERSSSGFSNMVFVVLP